LGGWGGVKDAMLRAKKEQRVQNGSNVVWGVHRSKVSIKKEEGADGTIGKGGNDTRVGVSAEKFGVPVIE